MNHPIWIIRYGLSDVSEMKKGAGEGWSCRFWLKACDLFVYLNQRFRSYQFEEEVLSSQTFIRRSMSRSMYMAAILMFRIATRNAVSIFLSDSPRTLVFVAL